jgi:tight adherence protein B
MLIWLLLFILFLLVFGGPVVLLLRVLDGSRSQKLKRLLAQVDVPGGRAAVVRKMEPPRQSPLLQVFQGVRGLRSLDNLVRRSGLKWGAAGVLSATLVTTAAGAAAGAMLRGSLGFGGIALGALLGASLPFLYVKRKANSLMRAFEAQLPEALDFLARSVRAGNALSVSIEMLIPEAAEPLGSEFRRVSREQSLGASTETALKNLIARVPLMELRFFVAVVLLQRETGGNLGEILTRLSVSIRERLRLKAQINAVSSQGRLTARVLSVLPIAVILGMNFISPAYMQIMTRESIGRAMLLAAVVSQLVGYLCMKKITNIEI